ncbi:MAG: response regulator [Candidatus Cloacimonetes bacterium]|nr:response regulator [Candidatus Cloacimonadota bacterium]
MENRSVLIIDDDLTLCEMTKEMLSMFNINAMIAETKEEAINLYKEKQDDIWLIVFDMHLEQNTGVEVFNALKKINGNFIPFLASGMITEADKQKFEDIGFLEIIAKPFSMKTLKQKIMEYMV